MTTVENSAVFWDIKLCGGLFDPEDGDDIFLRNFG
jgi:hypothetical protein